MNVGASRLARFAALTSLVFAVTASTPQVNVSPIVPENFDLDLKTAKQLRPQMFSSSSTAARLYPNVPEILTRLVKGVPKTGQRDELRWEVRILEGADWNALSSPDGTIYVDKTLADLAGSQAGLWAAILSHEIAHVVRRDWAKRYLYRKSLEASGGAPIVDANGTTVDSWIEAGAASAAMGTFCRQLEVEADGEGLDLMAQAGYHPDFVFALHHLLHARNVDASSLDTAMHPRWDVRDRELRRAYLAASLEYDRLWPEPFASPGGNPPILAFAEEPMTKTTAAGQHEIRVAMHCANLAGVVQVVLARRSNREPMLSRSKPSLANGVSELTGCTSDRTLVTFTLAPDTLSGARGLDMADVYILDDQGAILSRADVPLLGR